MEPIDLSDVLAKTDAKMQHSSLKRQQEREYLKKTYNNLGCHSLTEEELQELVIQYLKSQPQPFDLEVVVKNIIEMDRLFWSVDKEQEHLITTYGQKVRNLLTKEELLDLLKYCEFQPTPKYLFHYIYPESSAILGEGLSEVLIKIDIEMQRLGWTVERGREYLIEMYGKRSRILLTEEELLDFLRYLES